MTSSDHIPIPDGYKRCSRDVACIHPLGPILPATDEYFHRRYKSKPQLHTLCRACQNLASKTNNQRANQKEKEKVRQQSPQRKLYDHNRKQSIKYKAYEKSYRQSPKGRLNNCMKSHRRRAAERLLPNDFSVDDWSQALDAFAINGVHCCAYCGRPPGLWRTLVQDHFIPLYRGGGYTAVNIVPACHGEDGCNNSKNNRDAHEWLSWKFGSRKATKVLRTIEVYFETVKKRG